MTDQDEDTSRSEDLEKQVLDMRILNSGKDFLIQQLRQERESFFHRLLDASHKVGELETKLLQLTGPQERNASLERDVGGYPERSSAH